MRGDILRRFRGGRRVAALGVAAVAAAGAVVLASSPALAAGPISLSYPKLPVTATSLPKFTANCLSVGGGVKIPAGSYGWNFELQGQGSATLTQVTAVFHTKGTVIMSSGFTNHGENAVIITSTDDTLTAASADYTGNLGTEKFVLSDICFNGPPPVVPEAPLAIGLPIVAIVIFAGAFVALERRRRTAAGS